MLSAKCSVLVSIANARQFFAQQIFDVVHLISQQIELAGQTLNIGRGATVDFIIQFAAQAVFGVLAILAHHDDRRLDGGEHGEEQVQQNEGIGIPSDLLENYVEPGVNN